MASKSKGMGNAHSIERRGRRERRKWILIVCEGDETEVIYFKALRSELRLGMVKIEVEGAGGGDIKVIKYAIALRQRRKNEAKKDSEIAEFDETWAVFDKEGENKKPSFLEAVKLAEREGMCLAISEPSFEYWYLLHFKYTTQSFANGDAVIKVLERELKQTYRKNKAYFKQLYPKTDTAIDNAQHIFEYHNNSTTFPNPSTTVYKLVKILTDMKKVN